MRNQFNFVGDCPSIVNHRINETLNKLPNRRKQIVQFNILNTAVASIAAILLLFLVTWTINPVMAQGITFRDTLIQMLNHNPAAEEIIEAPLPAPEIKEAKNEIVPEETAALIVSEEQLVEIPAVVIDGYEFRLEDQIIYDGAQLTIAYNVRKANGSTMPNIEEFTKVHMAGFIRTRELCIGDIKLQSIGQTIYDWDDLYVYRQVMTYNMRNIATDVTDSTEFILSVGIYHYKNSPTDTIEHFAYLPFCVNTAHSDFATSCELEQNLFDAEEFIVEVLPIIESVNGIQIEVRVYKLDDSSWGKRVNEDMFVRIESLDGTPIGFTGSFGYGISANGTTYIETIYELSPDEKLPKQLRIYFSCGDANAGTEVDHEPIIITFK